MEHSIYSIPAIISEAHSSAVNSGLFGKRKQVYVLGLLVIFAWFKSEAVEAQSPQIVAPMPNEVRKDAFLRTFRLDYKLDPGKTKETGVFLSPDSAALISPGKAARYQKGHYHQDAWAFRVDFEGLEPYNRYFYRFFSKDHQNRITWSEITPTYTPGFNIRWTGAHKWVKGNNSMEIMLTGESVDAVPGYYQIFFGGKPCELLRITSSPNSAQSYYTIRLPRNAPPGIHRLVMMYKQKKIFDQDIEVL